MKIPTGPEERKAFYAELVRQCLSTRNDRFAFYQVLRNYFLFGTNTGAQAEYNKIGSTVETLHSFIYSPVSTKFSLYLGTIADPEDVFKAPVLAREITDQWTAGRSNMVFGVGLLWAHIFGTMLAKVMWHGRNARLYLVEPHQFGVLREDKPDIRDQEAFCMCYTTTRTQLERSLEGNPRKNRIMAEVIAGPSDGSLEFGGGLKRLITAGPVGGIPGSVAAGTGGGSVENMAGPTYDYVPRVDAELVDMIELYVYNDEEGDYQLVTLAAPDVVIYDRPQEKVGCVKGLPSFVPIRSSDSLYDYFWGEAFVAKLAPLQDWRTERITEIRNLLKKQSDPPMAFIGAGGIQDEKMAALRRAGGQVSFPDPSGRLQDLPPTMPPDAFAEIAQIDAMFDDMAGIGHVLQGKGEPGVRSRGQADLMARLGSSRPKQRAAVAEISAQDVATLMLRYTQEYSKQRFHTAVPEQKEPLTFTAKQFTTDFEVRVDAHSSSPIFIEDRKQDATQLLEAKAIDRETFLDMFDPPNLQNLQAKLRILEEKEAQIAQQELQARQQKKETKT